MRTLVLALLAVSAAPATAQERSGSADAARVAIRTHLGSVAPLAIVADSFHVIDVRSTGDFAAFRTVWAFTDTSGAYVDTTGTLVARLAGTGAALHVAGYDTELARHIADLVDEDRRRRYEDLIDKLHHVYHAIVEAGWYYKPDGIDPAALRARVDQGGHGMHDPWDITPITPGVAQVIWLTDATNAEATCALPITEGEGRPEGFEWVHDRQWITCRGRTPFVYSRADIPNELRDAMDRNGVLPPAPPVRR